MPVSGHDKELFFRKSAETNALSSFPPMCEFVEGIVTVAHTGPVRYRGSEDAISLVWPCCTDGRSHLRQARVRRGGASLRSERTPSESRPSCSRQVEALRLRGSTACVCPGAVWAAEAELPHLPTTARGEYGDNRRYAFP